MAINVDMPYAPLIYHIFITPRNDKMAPVLNNGMRLRIESIKILVSRNVTYLYLFINLINLDT